MKKLDNDLKNIETLFLEVFLPSVVGRKFNQETSYGYYSVFEICNIDDKEKEKETVCVVFEKMDGSFGKAKLINGGDHKGRPFSVLRIMVQRKPSGEGKLIFPTLQEIFDEFTCDVV